MRKALLRVVVPTQTLRQTEPGWKTCENRLQNAHVVDAKFHALGKICTQKYNRYPKFLEHRELTKNYIVAQF